MRRRRRRTLRLIGCSFGSSPPFVANVSSSPFLLLLLSRVVDNKKGEARCSPSKCPLRTAKSVLEDFRRSPTRRGCRKQSAKCHFPTRNRIRTRDRGSRPRLFPLAIIGVRVMALLLPALRLLRRKDASHVNSHYEAAAREEMERGQMYYSVPRQEWDRRKQRTLSVGPPFSANTGGHRERERERGRGGRHPKCTAVESKSANFRGFYNLGSA